MNDLVNSVKNKFTYIWWVITRSTLSFKLARSQVCPWVRPAACSLTVGCFLMARWTNAAMKYVHILQILICRDLETNCLTFPRYLTSLRQNHLSIVWSTVEVNLLLNSCTPWTWTCTCWPVNFPSHTWTATVRPGWWTPDSVYLHLTACHFFYQQTLHHWVKAVLLLQHGLFLQRFVVNHAWRRELESFCETEAKLLLGSLALTV